MSHVQECGPEHRCGAYMPPGIAWDNRVARNAKVGRKVGRLRMCCPGGGWDQGLKRSRSTIPARRRSAVLSRRQSPRPLPIAQCLVSHDSDNAPLETLRMRAFACLTTQSDNDSLGTSAVCAQDVVSAFALRPGGSRVSSLAWRKRLQRRAFARKP
jgi:hypothetical protein